ncbi:MAG: VCBS repeat-containing protein [Sandaracinaceae bacterium]|nr:VCBS repeat-containing protein [Sandaracinaceae bacterium]
MSAKHDAAIGALRALLSIGLLGCGPVAEPVGPEAYLRVGVTPSEEAAALRERLEASGWELTREVETERFVAVAFARGESERAVRVITQRGVVAALDSHEADGVRERHGLVTLADPAARDLDGDDREELVVLREGGPTPCLAVLRFDDRGGVRAAADDAASLREGACVARFEDVDRDGTLEAIVPLSWPELALDDDAPAIEVALVAREGGWHADGMPAVYVERVRAGQAEALAAAREHHDVSAAAARAVEIAALAHLTGAAVAAQVERFDAALSGVVLTDAQRDRVAEIRAVIGAGWREPEP